MYWWCEAFIAQLTHAFQIGNLTALQSFSGALPWKAQTAQQIQKWVFPKTRQSNKSLLSAMIEATQNSSNDFAAIMEIHC